MTDYLGPLALGTTGTYCLESFATAEADGALTAELAITVSAASADTLAVALEALAAAARAGNTYAHSEPGVTNPVTYVVTGCDKYELARGETDSAWLAFWQRVNLTLKLDGAPAGALTTPYSAQQLDTPAALTLASLLGTRPPELDLRILDDGGTNMHSVWACLAPLALTADQAIAMGTRAHYVVWAKSLTWTSMSNGGADAAMWSDDCRYTTSAAWQTAPLDTSKYPAGHYKLLARVKQAAGAGYIMDSQLQTAIAVTRTTPHLVEIGDLELPVQDTILGTASNLTLYARSDGTNRLSVDAFVLLPLEHGLIAWHPDLPTTEIAQLDVGPTGIFMDSVCDLTSLRGGILRPKVLAAHSGTLVATEEPAGNVWPDDWSHSAGVTADASRFKMVAAGADQWASHLGASTKGVLVVPGEWYEVSWTREVTARAAGSAYVAVSFVDADGNQFSWQTVDSVAATDGAPVNGIAYVKAVPGSSFAFVTIGTTGVATLTAYYSNVVMRRCPLNLLVIAEDAAGALTANKHPVHVTLKYRPGYEAAR